MWVRERDSEQKCCIVHCVERLAHRFLISALRLSRMNWEKWFTLSFFSVMLFLFICSDVAAVSNISASWLHQWNKLRDNEKEAAIEDPLFLTVNVVVVLNHNEGKWIGYYLRPISTYGRFQIFRALQEMSVSTGCLLLYPKTHTKQVLHWWRTYCANIKKYVLYNSVCSSICMKSRRITADIFALSTCDIRVLSIHDSHPVASWDCKMSIKYILGRNNTLTFLMY